VTAMMPIMRQTKKYRGLGGLGVILLSIASFLYTLFYFYIPYSASCIRVYTLPYPSDLRRVYTLPVSFTDTTRIPTRRTLTLPVLNAQVKRRSWRRCTPSMVNGIRLIARGILLVDGIPKLGRVVFPKPLDLFRLNNHNPHEVGLRILCQRGCQKHHLHLSCEYCPQLLHLRTEIGHAVHKSATFTKHNADQLLTTLQIFQTRAKHLADR
jgi:hypothetical protein